MPSILTLTTGQAYLRSVSGTFTSTGVIALANGTAALPSLAFDSDPDSGLYRIGADNIGIALGGAIEWNLTATAFSPGVSDGNALGTGSLMWSGLFLASGGVINFNNGDVTLTHTADTLTLAGGSLTVSSVGPHVIGGATNPSVQLLLTGSLSPTVTGRAFDLSTTVNAVGGVNAYGAYFQPTIVEAGSGTHILLAGARFDFTVTGGVATVTDTATVYISGAASATVTGENYAIWSDAGINRFDGQVSFGGVSAAGSYARITGTFNAAGADNDMFSIGGTLNAAAGAETRALLINTTTAEAGSGTHALIAGLRIASGVTGGVATVTNTAQLYIDGAMTATVTGANYQAWYAGGTTQKVRIDGQLALGANVALSSVAPTISSGFNTSPTVTNGTAFSFVIDTGTTAATNTGVIALPTAANGWSCHAQDLSDAGYVSQVASTTTSASFKYYSRTTGLQIAWPASVAIAFCCGAR